MDKHTRRFTAIDRLLIGLQQLAPPKPTRVIPSPAENLPDDPLSDEQRRHSAGLMRVNHAGEIAAQGLYTGQAVTARAQATRDLLNQAGLEEQYHLQWCTQRLDELSSRPSQLTPLWHGGSIVIGGINGLLGDPWSLGFVAETEHQVEKHLQGHLQRLPADDHRSRAVVEQMLNDEAGHRVNATIAGGKTLPWPVRLAMKATAKVMTTTAYRL
ncbi:MAG: 2-polyprenyl-3-methyl-6-methoxy-1,4-benzoquinone monooxygenase [Gammaproteobacteria bacterium]